MSDISGKGWTGRVTCDAMPVEVVGTIGDCPFYFRSRTWKWSISICEPGQDPVGYPYFDWDEWGENLYDASHMPHTDAIAIINRCVAKYLEGKKLSLIHI